MFAAAFARALRRVSTVPSPSRARCPQASRIGCSAERRGATAADGASVEPQCLAAVRPPSRRRNVYDPRMARHYIIYHPNDYVDIPAPGHTDAKTQTLFAVALPHRRVKPINVRLTRQAFLSNSPLSVPQRAVDFIVAGLMKASRADVDGSWQRLLQTRRFLPRHLFNLASVSQRGGRVREEFWYLFSLGKRVDIHCLLPLVRWYAASGQADQCLAGLAILKDSGYRPRSMTIINELASSVASSMDQLGNEAQYVADAVTRIYGFASSQFGLYPDIHAAGIIHCARIRSGFSDATPALVISHSTHHGSAASMPTHVYNSVLTAFLDANRPDLAVNQWCLPISQNCIEAVRFGFDVKPRPDVSLFNRLLHALCDPLRQQLFIPTTSRFLMEWLRFGAATRYTSHWPKPNIYTFTNMTKLLTLPTSPPFRNAVRFEHLVQEMVRTKTLPNVAFFNALRLWLVHHNELDTSWQVRDLQSSEARLGLSAWSHVVDACAYANAGDVISTWRAYRRIEAAMASALFDPNNDTKLAYSDDAKERLQQRGRQMVMLSIVVATSANRSRMMIDEHRASTVIPGLMPALQHLVDMGQASDSGKE